MDLSRWFRRANWWGVLSLLVLLAACGDDSSDSPTNPTPTYNNIAGSYSGVMSGLNQGVALNATFSLTINQNQDDLSGSYALQGTLDDGVTTVDIQGTGSLDGSIASGNNPSVNLTIGVGGCPNYSANFSGAYDTSNSRLTITGPIDILYSDCSLFLRYNMTIVLTR